jgi:hypothetical protein
MNFGIVKSFSAESGIGVVSSCGMDGDDLVFFVDPSSIKFEIGERVTFTVGKRAFNLRPDETVPDGERRYL